MIESDNSPVPQPPPQHTQYSHQISGKQLEAFGPRIVSKMDSFYPKSLFPSLKTCIQPLRNAMLIVYIPDNLPKLLVLISYLLNNLSFCAHGYENNDTVSLSSVSYLLTHTNFCFLSIIPILPVNFLQNVWL